MASDLTPTSVERQQIRRLKQQLLARGLDPATRHDLVTDYVLMARRVAALRAEETRATGRDRLAVARAVNVLLTERRRLFATIFAGARRSAVGPPAPPPVTAVEQCRQSEADQHWRRFFDGDRTLSSDDLHRLYGSPSWPVLLREYLYHFFDTGFRIARLQRDRHRGRHLPLTAPAAASGGRLMAATRSAGRRTAGQAGGCPVAASYGFSIW